MLAYDRTRVKLKAKNAAADYINASWIKDLQLTRAPAPLRSWIAAQGPLDYTVGDFLSLFLDIEKPPRIVVMLTAVSTPMLYQHVLILETAV